MRVASTAIVSVIVMASVAIVRPSVAYSQAAPKLASRAADRVGALITVPDTFPYVGADAVIRRRVNLAPNDVIILRKDRLTPALLSEAVMTLQAVRAREGTVPMNDVLIRVHDPRPVQRHAQDALGWIKSLLASSGRDVRGVGHTRAIEVLLRTDEVRVYTARP